MLFRFSNFLTILLFLLLGALYVNAQTADASDSRPGSKDEYSDGAKEMFAKQRLKAEEKEFNEMIDRSEEAAKISNEVYQSFETNQKLLPDDAKKIERLEKIVKKIRNELGSENADDPEQASTGNSLSFNDALKNIRETSSGLLSALKKQGRFSISVVAVESSNTLLKLVRFVRQNQN